MTTTTNARVNVYDEHGVAIATITTSRVGRIGSLLEQCDYGHVHVRGAAYQPDRGCPRCRLIGLIGPAPSVPHAGRLAS